MKSIIKEGENEEEQEEQEEMYETENELVQLFSEEDEVIIYNKIFKNSIKFFSKLSTKFIASLY